MMSMGPDTALGSRPGLDDTRAPGGSTDHSDNHAPMVARPLDPSMATGFSLDPGASVWPLVTTWAADISFSSDIYI